MSTSPLMNGINLKMIPARDAYAYALALMNIMFTPDEMSTGRNATRNVKIPILKLNFC